MFSLDSAIPNSILILFMACSFAGCASYSKHARLHVSNDIEQRTGHDLSPDANPTEQIPPDIQIHDGVSEEEAVSLALWNYGPFQVLLTELGFARADVIQAGMLQNPGFSILFPRGPRNLEASIVASMEAVWLRWPRISAAEMRARNVGQRLVQNGLDLVRDVRVAYANYALAEERLRLGREGAELRTRIEELSAKRFAAGDISEFEVKTTQIDAMRAFAETRSLEKDVELARNRILLLTGLGQDHQNLKIVNLAGVDNRINSDEKMLLQEAFAARPDLRAAEYAAEAAGKQIGLSWMEIVKIDAYIDGDQFNTVDSQKFEIGSGFKSPIPLFNWNQDARARGRAELLRSLHQQNAIRNMIVFEVHEALTRYQQAQEITELQRTKILPTLEQAVVQVEKAYADGNSSYLLTLESARQLLDARLKAADAEGALLRARAELERAVGRRLDLPSAADSEESS